MSTASWQQRRRNDFENSKSQCLGKRDKSHAGRIDPKAVDICAVLNEREDCYTTSSCAGRCFLYQGTGIKASTEFKRFRKSHDLVHDPVRYFNLSTIETDPSGGGDPIRTIGQYDFKEEEQDSIKDDNTQQQPSEEVEEASTDQTIWLRFEPFILHVACRSLGAASALMAAARPAFKNVGLTTWKDQNKYLVAIWGDEGLEMPMCTPDGTSLYGTDNQESISHWLAQLVNERHERNWKKIHRFVQSVREMGSPDDDDENEMFDPMQEADNTKVPKSFDVIGDVAYLHSIPDGDTQQIGDAIMKKNKAIKLVVARQSTLIGTERAPGSEGLKVIAGVQRSPLVTTHTEYGIKCIVDLNHCFFTPRMGPERLRICQQVARGENVLVLFAGVSMDALQIAGRTEASSVISVELNEVAVTCAQRAHRQLARNKTVKCAGAAERLSILQGDVLEIVPTLPKDHFDRILAPRPKEGALDGDLGNGDGGAEFLNILLPHLTHDGGECHWYDFVADHEFPECERTKRLLERICREHGLSMEVLHVANVGSVAKRQFRVCLDFKVSGR
jgi:tRNA G37 N-methylase Trm5